MSRSPQRRIYVDTSVFGGCFDEEFFESSQALYELVRSGTFKLVVSQVTLHWRWSEMPKLKSFDCVEMKNEIQRKMLEKYEGLTPEEVREEQRREIENDPILGPLYREMQVYDPASDH